MRPQTTDPARSGAGALARRAPEHQLSLYADIGQGAGLSGATGIRPFLPTLLAGALARGDVLIDFDGSGWQFLESPWFLFAVFALALLRFGGERSGANPRLLERGTFALGLILGALLFAGSLAAGDHAAWPGLIAGVACALLAGVALGGLFERAASRLDEDGAGMLTIYAEGAGLLLALVAILVPPLAFVALAGFLLLLVRGGQSEGRKYAGLRVLR